MLNTKTRGPAILAIGAGLALVIAAGAQSVPPGDPYAYPQDVGSTAAPMHRPPSFRYLFAQTLSTVLQGSLSAASLGITELIVGRISSWFARRGRGDRRPSGAAPVTAAGRVQSIPGAMSVPVGAPTYTTDTSVVVHVGLAYEVHMLLASGQTRIVDPAVHSFTTGDRFIVQLRPALPGWLDVSNVDPAGRERFLDSRTMAGGELLTLGPYEFVDVTGEDVLRLVVSPCESPQLLAQTRSIVNVSAAFEAARSEPQLALSRCHGGRTRSAFAAPTRTIRNVEHDTGTSFALDPVPVAELETGSFEPREVRIVFLHR